MSSITEGSVSIDGLEVAYLTLGEGPLALCLHGFPDTAHTWRHLLPELANAGFKAVAPFSRGYAPTEVPANASYQSGALARDAELLHEALGGDSDAVIIGHDWGALAAYGAASHDPDRWRRVVTMAVPPGGALAEAFTSYDQIRRSSYMFFFLHPLSDIVIPMNDYAFIRGLWNDWSPGFNCDEDVRNVAAALDTPERIAAALGYYRASWGGEEFQEQALGDYQAATGQLPSQPLLYIHGLDDGCIGAEVAAKVPAILGPDSEMREIANAGHFMHLEQVAEVNKAVCDWVSK